MTALQTRSTVHQIFDEAAEKLGHSQLHAPWDGEDNLQALLFKKALEITVERSQTIRSVQMQIVAQATRKQAWLSHPPTDDYPDGYADLKDMLTDAGLKGSTHSYLLALGNDIIPFCDANDILIPGNGDSVPIDGFLINSLRPKLEYAITALKAGVHADNPDAVEEVLKDVLTFASRAAIGAKYHTPRSTRYGHGTTVRLSDGRALVILVMDDESSIDTIIRRVAGVVEWGLPAQADVGVGLIEATVYDKDYNKGDLS